VAEGVVLKKCDFGSYMLQNIFELERRTGIKLGLAQKTLLAETGTIEQILSILTGSTVRVNILKQRENEKTISRESVILNDTDRILIRAFMKGTRPLDVIDILQIPSLLLYVLYINSHK
jgi:ribosomal protein S28E/S33